ncbi:MAG: HAMP domain-containing histidine kinase [Firmicutes bacterium]|nr:HAMP domain-containing histidine kinase [Bacillota bacterium]
MFRNLRLKLTLINVVVVAFITAFFMAGIYIMMVSSINRQSDQLMQLIATEAGSSTQSQVTRRERHWFNYFYVKTDQSGNITETSPNLVIPHQELQLLVNNTLKATESRGRVRWYNDEYYRFIKAPLNNGRGLVLVFLNQESQNETIGHLLGAFTVTGLGVLALALFGSFFMANRALIPIRESWERQKNFVTDASHELRTPLAVIQTNLDIVKSNPGEPVESQMRWLENIDAESKLMAKLVNNLLFLARADSNQELMNMENFSLDLALKEALTPFNPVAAQKGINLNILINSQVNFYGDQTRIKQLVAILIDNAIKYTPSGGAVNLELRDLPNAIDILVFDTGEGIDKEHLDKIFQRFYRIDKARSRESGGTGLGLSIADWIVKGHHGTIRVTSSSSVGTTFIINLPKRK